MKAWDIFGTLTEHDSLLWPVTMNMEGVTRVAEGKCVHSTTCMTHCNDYDLSMLLIKKTRNCNGWKTSLYSGLESKSQICMKEKPPPLQKKSRLWICTSCKVAIQFTALVHFSPHPFGSAFQIGKPWIFSWRWNPPDCSWPGFNLRTS